MLDDGLAFAQPVVGSHQHSDLRGEAKTLAHVGIVLVVAFVRVVKTQGGNGGAKHLHRRCALREGAEQIDHFRVELARFRQPFAERIELRPARQLAKPQKVGRFLEVRPLSQLVDVNPAVCQHACVAVDPADARVGRNDPLKPLAHHRRRHTEPPLTAQTCLFYSAAI